MQSAPGMPTHSTGDECLASPGGRSRMLSPACSTDGQSAAGSGNAVLVARRSQCTVRTGQKSQPRQTSGSARRSPPESKNIETTLNYIDKLVGSDNAFLQCAKHSVTTSHSRYLREDGCGCLDNVCVCVLNLHFIIIEFVHD